MSGVGVGKECARRQLGAQGEGVGNTEERLGVWDGGMDSDVSPCTLAKNLGLSWSVRVTGMGNILADGFVTERTSGGKYAMILKGQPGEEALLPGGEF